MRTPTLLALVVSLAVAVCACSGETDTTPGNEGGTSVSSGNAAGGATASGAGGGSASGGAATGGGTASSGGGAGGGVDWHDQQGDSCPPDGCAPPLECLTYCGISCDVKFSTCEIPCDQGQACPDGQTCVNIADGPGNVCRP